MLRTRLGQSELGECYLADRDGEVCGVYKRFTVEQTRDPTFRASLSSELSLAAQLRHPAIGAVLEQGEVGGRAFVLMEYVEGVTLAQLIRAARQSQAFPVSMPRAVALLTPVLQALAAAHALQPVLLHRDLTPENILCTSAGRVVLTDFGLGRVRQRVGGAANLKRAYVSPEQARGMAIDVRSELFAAGLLLFELVCGRLPAQGGPGEVISRIATGELDAPKAVNPALEDAAAAVLTRALAQGPEARFASATEFAEALTPWAAAEQTEALGPWVAALRVVKLEAALTRAPAPEKSVDAPAVTIVVPAALPKAPPSRGSAKRKLAGFAVAAALFAIALPVSNGLKGEVAVAGTRALELTSIPSGATILVDNAPVGRTPLTLAFGKNEMHHLTLRKAGFPTWEGIARNTSRIQVDLATGGHENALYDGEKAAPRSPPVTPPEPAAAPAPPVEAPQTQAPATVEPVIYDVESPPLIQVLDRHHSVLVDETPAFDAPDGAEVVQKGTAMLYEMQPPRFFPRRATRAFESRYASLPNPAARPLALFALLRVGAGLEAFSIAHPVKLAQGGRVHFFSLTEGVSDQFQGGSRVLINDHYDELRATVLVRIPSDHGFRVRVLRPELTYRLSLVPKGGGLMPPVLISLRLPTATANDVPRLRLDGQVLDARQVLISAGAHTLSGASSVVFTLPTLEGVVPGDVALTLMPPGPR